MSSIFLAITAKRKNARDRSGRERLNFLALPWIQLRAGSSFYRRLGRLSENLVEPRARCRLSRLTGGIVRGVIWIPTKQSNKPASNRRGVFALAAQAFQAA